MKFEINQEVKVKTTGIVGIVKAIRYETYMLYGELKEITQYGILSKGSYYKDWYPEDQLTSALSYEFDDVFELGLRDLLIDTYLLHKKLDLVEMLCKSNKA